MASVTSIAAWRAGANNAPSLIPTQWLGPVWQPLAHVSVVLNWLDIEVDPTAPQRMPILHEIRGWRNREVHEYVASRDYTARMYSPEEIELSNASRAGASDWAKAQKIRWQATDWARAADARGRING